MAVAENPITEKTPRNPQQVLGLGSIIGAVYVMASLAVVFSALPSLWDYVVIQMLDTQALANNLLLSSTLLLVLEVGVGLVLLRGANELVKARGDLPGLRAGIFFACLLLGVIIWFTRLIGLWLENLFENQPILGLVITLAVFTGLLFGLFRWFMRPRFAAWLVEKEDHGWFHATTYKPNQGLRVRRGTVIGALVLGIWGIITLVSHKALGSEGVNQLKQTIENNWVVRVPFFGESLDRPRVALGIQTSQGQGGLAVTAVTGHAGKLAGFKVNDLLVSLRSADQKEVFLDSEAKLNEELFKYRPQEVVKVTVKREGQDRLLDCPLESTDANWIILHRVHFTVPLLLAVLLLWFCWRLINWPAFADFLIATEAEMNKVSWASRRRLIQDTIVVLVTVALLAAFLFVADLAWVWILQKANVLQVDVKEVVQKQQEKTQW